MANLASPQDANYLSVLQFAVDVINVQYIMVVGYYGCGGVSAAIDGNVWFGDDWLHPIRELSRTHSRELTLWRISAAAWTVSRAQCDAAD